MKNEKKAKNGKSKKIMSRLRGGANFLFFFLKEHAISDVSLIGVL